MFMFNHLLGDFYIKILSSSLASNPPIALCCVPRSSPSLPFPQLGRNHCQDTNLFKVYKNTSTLEVECGYNRKVRGKDLASEENSPFSAKTDLLGKQWEDVYALTRTLKGIQSASCIEPLWVGLEAFKKC